ncbi:uncharacterized protein LOC135398350 [Ornithodoros turicata]|uniref:uncharacterized protein LOC135398350 n=1 Tax=Ornithodoros turicata TaxID=34597 RepID=UPI00313A09B1
MPGTVNQVKKCMKTHLDVFFTAKTHKQGLPFRPIVSERGSWQSHVSSVLRKGLNLVEVNDPYYLSRSEEVTAFLGSLREEKYDFRSFDVEDMFFNLDTGLLLRLVEEELDRVNPVTFSTETGMSSRSFVELLRIYLLSTTVEFQKGIYRQKKGVCIGSRLAPAQSNIYLAAFDRQLQGRLQRAAPNMLRICRYVDDYLLVSVGEVDWVPVLQLFQTNEFGLKFTLEEPARDTLQFLDLRLIREARHLCWMYGQRTEKPLLPFNSNHMKMGIVNSLVRACVVKSCQHRVEASLREQLLRLLGAGYPIDFTRGVVRRLLKGSRGSGTGREERPEKTVVIPYVHGATHRLVKVAQKQGIKVVPTVRSKLSSLPGWVAAEDARPTSGVKHRNRFVECCAGVVYSIPTSCGRQYVGETSRCLNDRIREHRNKVDKKDEEGSRLAGHVIYCRCRPQHRQTKVLYRSKDVHVRHVLETKTIMQLKDKCVSAATATLTEKQQHLINSGRVF